MVKKVLCALLAAAFVFLFCSCGGSGSLKSINRFIESGIYTDWDEISSEKSEEIGSLYKNYFDELSETQKKAYNKIISDIMKSENEFPEKIEIPLMSGDELTQVYEAVVYDNPDMMCFGSGGSIITEGDLCFFKPDYTVFPSEFFIRLEKMEKYADEICMSFSSDATDFEKELFIHDRLIKNCEYDCESQDAGTAYSCFFNGYASCEGYAKATKYLLEKAGIECYNIIGSASNNEGENESHMWNVVCIGGYYYHLDTTWDDPVEGSRSASHIYFNLTENEISVDHTDFKSGFLCENTDDNYFERTDSIFSDAYYYSIKAMETVAIKNLERNDRCVQYRFDSDKSYAQAVNVLIDQSQAYTIQRNIKALRPDLYVSDEISYSKYDSYRVLEFIF